MKIRSRQVFVEYLWFILCCVNVTTGQTCSIRFVGGKLTSHGNFKSKEAQDIVTDIKRKAADEKATSLRMDGWLSSENYLFKLFTERVNYDTAGKRCQIFGGRLATEILRHPNAVRHIIDAKYVITYLNGTTPWIGFNDIAAEGSWRWVDGGTMNPRTSRWRAGEPSGGAEDCGTIFETSKDMILLNDAPCSFTAHYICEIDMS